MTFGLILGRPLPQPTASLRSDPELNTHFIFNRNLITSRPKRYSEHLGLGSIGFKLTKTW